MNVSELIPPAVYCETFRRNRERFVPARPGCYVLTTFDKTVLYVGLATNLRHRMANHLDDPIKTGTTKFGRVIWFHWIETSDIEKIERTWMNIHIQHEGSLPLLNKVYSPVST